MLSEKPKILTYPDEYVRFYNNPDYDLIKTVTFQVTDACNLKCSYCYQINKGIRVMSFEDAKKLVDMILTNDKKMNGYLNLENTPGIILEFIGGEPFLQVELIEQICDYFVTRAIELHHPWALFHRFSISSNGTLYFNPKVQHFLDKYKHELSLTMTLDGNKQLHDSCRVFPDGSPSYDLVESAIIDFTQRKHCFLGSKVTVAPANVGYLYDAIDNMYNLGFKDIHQNCVYEEGWNIDHAKIYYQQLKQIADLIVDNDHNNPKYYSIFSSNDMDYMPLQETYLDNWCGGNGRMIAMDPVGDLYPCIRYMESSLGNDRPPFKIGNIDEGIGITREEQQRLQCLECITRKSQSTEKCFKCPIAGGCGWCSGYNYQLYGTPDKRATFICDMHKAESLARAYAWNKQFIILNDPRRIPIMCPREWALNIIDESEYQMLLNMAAS